MNFNDDLLSYYFPTTVLFIDDNRRFLKNITTEVLAEQIACISYDNPRKALEYLDKNSYSNQNAERYLLYSESKHRDHHDISINLRAIHYQIYNPQRFKEISTLVIDYAMPAINGLFLCEQIRHKFPNIKIILLTGEADEKIAISAFNSGLIDKYLKKDEENFMNRLLTGIQQLQQIYFQNLSKFIIDSLMQDADFDTSIFKDRIFKNFFQSFCIEEKIIEFYLLERSGSYLCLDTDGNLKLLIVKNEDDMESFYHFAENANATNKILNTLRAKKAVPYFHTDDDFDTPPSSWGKFLYPAKLIESNQNYYYAYLRNINIQGTNQGKIFSYQEYLKSLL